VSNPIQTRLVIERILPAIGATIRLAGEHDDGVIELVERLSREDTRIVPPVLAAITLAAEVIALALQTYFGRLPFWC
jgi:hypothetical protein